MNGTLEEWRHKYRLADLRAARAEVQRDNYLSLCEELIKDLRAMGRTGVADFWHRRLKELDSND